MDISGVLFACVGLSFLSFSNSSSITEEKNLLNTLLRDYDKNIRPRDNNGGPINITFGMFLQSLTRLDTTSGVLTTSGSMFVYWDDVNLKWEPSSHGNITEISLSIDQIWSPRFTVSNSATRRENIGKSAAQIHVYWHGNVVWEFGDVLHTVCDVVVTHFPFDVQQCDVEFMPIGLYYKDLNIIPHSMNTSLYNENKVWSLDSTTVELAYHGFHPYIKYTLHLKRRPSFYLLNISPALILSFLNTMVFVIPADSGERIGYAITCILSLTVYMTFASENLPNSSRPVPTITFVLLTHIIISTLICVGTIIGMRIHLHDKSVSPPSLLMKLLYCSSHKTCCKKKVDLTETIEGTQSEEDMNAIHWREISSNFDKMCFVWSNMCIFFLSFLYMLMVNTSSK